MSSSEYLANVGEKHLAPHFATRASQDDAARLGMWIFLATEILLFAGLFVCYAYYRFVFPDQFAAASEKTYVAFGTANTFVLVTSSFTVALAYHHVKTGRNRSGMWLLLLSATLGLAFLAVKGAEWATEILHGEVVGKDLFLTLYYSMTGLHAIHVTVGIGILLWLTWRTSKNEFSPEWHTPVELGAMYWHLVDLIWLYLFPLIYLVDRSRGP